MYFRTWYVTRFFEINMNITISESTAIDICEETEINKPGTEIATPNYPNNYDYSRDCTLTIRFSASQTVSITFEAFEVEEGWDYLKVFDSNNTYEAQIGSTLDGDTDDVPVGTTIQSTGNVMTLRFKSDSAVNKAGFKIIANAGKNIDYFSSWGICCIYFYKMSKSILSIFQQSEIHLPSQWR